MTVKINILTPVHPGGPQNWGNDLVNHLNKKGYQARNIHTLFELLSIPIYQNADIIHTTVPLAFRLWKKPIVLSIHGDYSRENNLWKHFYPTALTKADIITTPSKFLKELLNLNHAIVIPNAIFPENFKQVEYSEKDTINLVTITKFYFEDKAKGALKIFDILRNIPKDISKRVKYTVVGGGPYLKAIMEQAKNIDIPIIFTGMVPNPRQYLESSDIFLYYSDFDNFPIVLLEAMACGLPVITNSVGAVKEIIENGKDGFVAENDTQYSEYLSTLINSVDIRNTIGRNARKTIELKFNWENVVNQYIELYRKLS